MAVISRLSHRYLRLYTDKANYYVIWAYMTSYRVSVHSFVGCTPITASLYCHPSRSTQTPLWGVHKLLPRLKGIATGGDPKVSAYPKGDDRQCQSKGHVHRRGVVSPRESHTLEEGGVWVWVWGEDACTMLPETRTCHQYL